LPHSQSVYHSDFQDKGQLTSAQRISMMTRSDPFKDENPHNLDEDGYDGTRQVSEGIDEINSQRPNFQMRESVVASEGENNLSIEARKKRQEELISNGPYKRSVATSYGQ